MPYAQYVAVRESIFKKTFFLFAAVPTFFMISQSWSQSDTPPLALRQDPQNPITEEQLAKAKIETSTPTFNYKDFYIGPQVGASILMDVTGTLRVLNLSGDGDLEMNAGIRLDVPVGYTLSDFFAFEFAPGILYNSFSKVNAAGASADVDGYLLQVPLLVNMVWSFNTEAVRYGKNKFRPYFGGGIGATLSLAKLNSVNLLNQNFSINSNANTWSIGYQAILGLDYDFDEETSFGIRYQFTGTSNQNFSDAGVSISTGGLLSQNIMLRFIHRF